MSKASAQRDGSGSYHTREVRALARVVGKRSLGSMTCLTLGVPGWKGAKAGQFVLVQAEHSRFFLGRPFSVCSENGAEISLLISPVGEGTRELCSVEEDSSLWVLGPLGNGFDLKALGDDGVRVVLVGGGAGVAPLPLLMSQLRDTAQELVVVAGYGDAAQASAGQLLVEETEKAVAAGREWAYNVCTEDGSEGNQGRVNELLREHIRPEDRLAVCGPEPMARAVWQECAGVSGVRVWFSLETVMACGVGSCHGCVVRLADDSYARVCREGPVFEGEVVFGG